jgi:4-hydroxyphenylpyruvate dioxygenase-like putative hemolysin
MGVEEETKQAACCLMPYFTYSSAQMMEAVLFYETSSKFYQTILRHIPAEKSILHSQVLVDEPHGK